VTHIIVEYEHDRDQQLATDAGRILSETYPGHEWHVDVRSGALSIKHGRISTKWAMVLHYKRVAHDYSVLRKGVIWAGGELLERAGLSRKVPEYTPIKSVDGVPMKHLLLQNG
jgi:hypothetical protein